MENLNDVKCWDYNQEILNFGNINGYVCLRSVLIFGISSLLLMYIIVPLCFYLAKNMNKKTIPSNKLYFMLYLLSRRTL